MPNIRYQYDDDNMQKAIQAVRDGSSKRSAAQQYDVPRTTLNDKIAGRTPESRRIGKDPVLSSDEESSNVQ